jgi:hypothetical protein
MTVFAMAIVLILSNVPHLGAQNNNQQDEDESSLIQQGFAIAPVPLNLTGKNRSLVGLGSCFKTSLRLILVSRAVIMIFRK